MRTAPCSDGLWSDTATDRAERMIFGAFGTGDPPLSIHDAQSEPYAAAKGLYYETGAALTHLTNGRI
ncbi:hypothetical protein JM93_00034 [Roseibium hamelinense]|uniref:Uncharacterized protein n=1 Tax=Roseibium hamelinense TaxID=150831 RepID=A0A562TG26_9HYPH|nr:hypothetical protein [Roseibium hamelinense]MTI42462.1 hypothetical protein [Roseibium hamelinense]TWI92492.1 hypothetical protein JM93_00034 [Roseibium hamelinense]